MGPGGGGVKVGSGGRGGGQQIYKFVDFIYKCSSKGAGGMDQGVYELAYVRGGINLGVFKGQIKRECRKRCK